MDQPKTHKRWVRLLLVSGNPTAVDQKRVRGQVRETRQAAE